jgi:hypothetical protein
MTSAAPRAVYLMLDFDGVLHAEGCAPGDHFCRLHLLEAALRRWPELCVVVSSMWRLDATLDGLRRHFAPDIAPRVVGMTPDLFDPTAPGVPGLRQRECEAWIAAHDPGAPWIALDDRPEAFDAPCEQLVAVPFCTDGGAGLEPCHLDALEARLQRLRHGRA